MLSLAHGSLDAPKAPQVFTRTVKSQEIYDLLNYPARVEAKVNTTVLSESDGVITQVLPQLGSPVRKKQKLMILTHTDPVYQYAPVQIVSPIQGVVSSIEVHPGSHVVQGQKLITVIDPSQTEITLEAPAQDLPYLKTHLVGEFKPSSQESSFSVKIIGISPFVDPVTGTAQTKLKIEMPAKKDSTSVLVPGMQGQVIFKVNVHSGFSIPDSAVVYQGKDSFIRIVENGKVKQIPAVLGKKLRGLVEIKKGLFSNAVLIERSSRAVSDGEAVIAESAQKL
jgi:multidrug efflux pump subunit AcrA (membrane-fusion protein)